MNDRITRNIHQRMLGVMEEVAFVNKDKKNSFMKFDYVSHDNVTASIRPYLIKHGINVTFDVVDYSIRDVQDEKGNCKGLMTSITALVSFINADNPSERIDIHSIGQGIDKNDLGPGKAMSYAYKYALLKAFALETGLDNEASAGAPAVGGKASNPPKPEATSTPQQPRYYNTFPKHVQEAVDGVPAEPFSAFPFTNPHTPLDPNLKQQLWEIVTSTFEQANAEFVRHGVAPMACPEEYANSLMLLVKKLTPNVINGLKTRTNDAIQKLIAYRHPTNGNEM